MKRERKSCTNFISKKGLIQISPIALRENKSQGISYRLYLSWRSDAAILDQSAGSYFLIAATINKVPGRGKNPPFSLRCL